MIAIDTNILARFYVSDPTDPEAAGQRAVAFRVMTETEVLFVPVTVVLELAWVLRAFYRFDTNEIAQVLEHLVGLPNVHVEDVPAVQDALTLFRQGLDIADAIHLSRSRHCEQFLTFDERRFARRASRLEWGPEVVVPE